MYERNTDLLPPLFDQVLSHYGDGAAGPDTRSDIVTALENGIVDAAADSVRSARMLPDWSKSKETGEVTELKTVDRLSGTNLSRAALIEQLQTTVPLSRVVLEIALLLIEAQIDLRLKRGKSFELSGIEFVCENTEEDIASWCQSILQSTLQGTTNDTPSVWSRLGPHHPAGLRILVEGMQLSATLRDAVPYKIRVKNHLIDPKLAEPRPDARIRLLHISDLHLVEDITEEGRSLGRPILAATHSFNMARLLGKRVDGFNPKFDLVLATGDLTTDGRRGSFETVLQYFQSGPSSGENKMRIRNFGLNAGKARRLLIPGNHDRFGGELVPNQRHSDVFEKVLGTPHPYPYVVGYRPPGREPTSLTLLFFVFDSTLPEGRESSGWSGWARAIAQGRIGSEEISEAFDNQAQDIVKNGKVRGLSGEVLDFDPKNTVRIAVLHHHPVVTPGADEEIARREQGGWRWPRLSKKEFDAELVKMNGAEEFLRGCFRAGVQLILFGHQHFPYRRLIKLKNMDEVQGPFGAIKAIYAFCCPTTLEFKAPSNGFYVFDFFDKANVTIDSYISMRDGKKNSMGFTRDTKTSRSYDLAAPDQSDLESAYTVQ
jgi:3',5'-cyclic AMP phosphodiesterase CpdA